MPISPREHKHIAERSFCSLFRKEEHLLALLLTVCSCHRGSIYTTLLEKLSLRAASALLLLSSLFPSLSLFSFYNIKAFSCMIRRSSATRQRDRGALRWMRIRFTLTALDRECENREYPTERQDNKEMQEPANVKIVMTHGFMGGHATSIEKSLFFDISFLF